LAYLYSTIKMMHGPINLRRTDHIKPRLGAIDTKSIRQPYELHHIFCTFSLTICWHLSN